MTLGNNSVIYTADSIPFSIQLSWVTTGTWAHSPQQVNMGPVLPPQRKGRCPQYARDKLVELQDKFDELEAVGVFRRPEDIGVAVE